MAARFVRTREDFTCGHCGAAVTGSGYTNHCPRCLWSRHVDVHPGDRAASCGALMEPVAATVERGEPVLVQRCTGCGHLWRNRTSPEDDPELLRSLLAQPAPAPAGRRPPRRSPRAGQERR